MGKIFDGLACIRHTGDDPIKYVDEFYHRKNGLEAYKIYYSPIYGHKHWQAVDEPPILPPFFVRQPGRARKNRRKEIGEERRQGKQKLSNKGARVAYTRCKIVGHNVRTCKEPAPQQNDLSAELPPKRKAGRPKKCPNASGASPLERREIRQAMSGYGVLTSESGNIYIRTPGAEHTNMYR